MWKYHKISRIIKSVECIAKEFYKKLKMVFYNNANKENLIKLVPKLFQSAEGHRLQKIPLVITYGEEAWETSKSKKKSFQDVTTNG